MTNYTRLATLAVLLLAAVAFLCHSPGAFATTTDSQYFAINTDTTLTLTPAIGAIFCAVADRAPGPNLKVQGSGDLVSPDDYALTPLSLVGRRLDLKSSCVVADQVMERRDYKLLRGASAGGAPA